MEFYGWPSSIMEKFNDMHPSEAAGVLKIVHLNVIRHEVLLNTESQSYAENLLL